MPISTQHKLTAIRVFAAAASVLPWGSGQYRLAQPLAKLQTWPPGFTAEQMMSSGARLRLDLSDRTQLLTFMLRDYSPATTQYIDHRLPHGGVFFDIGGHVGMIAFAVASLRPDVTIRSFEPNPVNIAGWHRNHALNPTDRASLVEKGLSDHDGELRFLIAGDSASGMASDDGDQIVPVTTLDGYCAANGIDQIDVLKIDTQGHEPAVLRGAHRMLSEGRVDTLLCEVCDPLLALHGDDRNAIIAPLNAHGYVTKELPEAGLRRVLPWVKDGLQEDLVFERA